MNKRLKIAIIGGGASGMTAAIYAADQRADVTILEHKDRIGIKIRSTGNGKCNFSNESISVSDYHTDDENLLAYLLQQFHTQDAIRFFEDLGLMVKVKNGGLYPANEQASAVLEVLMYRLRELNVSIHTNVSVNSIRLDQRSQQYYIDCSLGHLSFDRVILACGGKATFNTGSDGSGYVLSKQLQLCVSELYPALTGLRAKGNFWKQLAGIRCNCSLSLLADGKVIADESGELQLTDYGLSGIPIFQLSAQAAMYLAKGNRTQIVIDFLPKVTVDELMEYIKRKLPHTNTYTAEEFWVGTIHKKLIPFFLKRHDISPSCMAKDVTMSQWEMICSDIKGWLTEIKESNGFAQAQVTAGGVLLSEITNTCESKKLPGCYIIGELLNVDGRCGGYNLHFAWASGKIAGCAAAKRSDE